ncbi:hypothetical protein EDC01DRAFT_633206 [Geopyxis carbonaria]|nr:hypothetical protein EDC01DRAFT_633206 [Geopyxis carbonaria]
MNTDYPSSCASTEETTVSTCSPLETPSDSPRKTRRKSEHSSQESNAEKQYAPLKLFDTKSSIFNSILYNPASRYTHPVYNCDDVDRRTMVVSAAIYHPSNINRVPGIALVFGPANLCPHNLVAPVPRLAVLSGEADVWLAYKAMFEALRLVRMDPVEDILLLKVVIHIPKKIVEMLKPGSGHPCQGDTPFEKDGPRPWVYNIWKEMHTEAIGKERIAIEWWPAEKGDCFDFAAIIAKRWARQGARMGWKNWYAN